MPRTPGKRALRVRWFHSPPHGGPCPLQALVEWLLRNRETYYRAEEQINALSELHRQLTARGIQCKVEDIFFKIDKLKEEIYNATLVGGSLSNELKPYRARLLYCLLTDDEHRDKLDERKEEAVKEANRSRRVNARPTPQHRALPPSEPQRTPTDEQSPILELISWLPRHYERYASASEDDQISMLRPLSERITMDGHEGWTEAAIAGLINKLKEEAKKAARRKRTTLSEFRDHRKFSMELFDESRERRQNSVARHSGNGAVYGTDDVEMSDQDNNEADVNHVQAAGDRGVHSNAPHNANHTDQRAHVKRSWTSRPEGGGPTKMMLLVGWLQDNYSEFATGQRGVKKTMLLQLVKDMAAAGHRGCEVDQIRSKIDSLQREARGDKPLSPGFIKHDAALREIFSDCADSTPSADSNERDVGRASTRCSETEEAKSEDVIDSQATEDDPNLESNMNHCARFGRDPSPVSAGVVERMENLDIHAATALSNQEEQRDAAENTGSNPQRDPGAARDGSNEAGEEASGMEVDQVGEIDRRAGTFSEDASQDRSTSTDLPVGASAPDAQARDRTCSQVDDVAAEPEQRRGSGNCTLVVIKSESEDEAENHGNGQIVLPSTMENRSRVVRCWTKLLDASVPDADIELFLPKPTHEFDVTKLSTQAIGIRLEVCLARKKLQDAHVSITDIELFFPAPRQVYEDYTHLGVRSIETRKKVCLARKKLHDEGAPDVEIDHLLPTPPSLTSKYPFGPNSVDGLKLLATERRKLRLEGSLERVIDAFHPLTQLLFRLDSNKPRRDRSHLLSTSINLCF